MKFIFDRSQQKSLEWANYLCGIINEFEQASEIDDDRRISPPPLN